MFKKIMFSAAAIAVAVTFSACSSFNHGALLNDQKLTDVDTVQSIAHVNGSIWGIYLFDLPLFSGSSIQPGRCAIFKDTVTINDAVSMVTEQSRVKLDSKRVLDMTSRRSYFPFLIIFYESVEVSGNAVR